MPVSKFVGSLYRDPDLEEAIQVAAAEYGILCYAASFSVQGDDTQFITVANIGAQHVQIAAENCLYVSKLYQSRWAQLYATLSWLPSNTMSATLVLLSTPEIGSDVTAPGVGKNRCPPEVSPSEVRNEHMLRFEVYLIGNGSHWLISPSSFH